MNERDYLVIEGMLIETVKISDVYVPIINRIFESVCYNSNARLVEKSGKGGLIDILD